MHCGGKKEALLWFQEFLTSPHCLKIAIICLVGICLIFSLLHINFLPSTDVFWFSCQFLLGNCLTSKEHVIELRNKLFQEKKGSE